MCSCGQFEVLDSRDKGLWGFLDDNDQYLAVLRWWGEHLQLRTSDINLWDYVIHWKGASISYIEMLIEMYYGWHLLLYSSHLLLIQFSLFSVSPHFLMYYSTVTPFPIHLSFVVQYYFLLHYISNHILISFYSFRLRCYFLCHFCFLRVSPSAYPSLIALYCMKTSMYLAFLFSFYLFSFIISNRDCFVINIFSSDR